jgi:hypothetical protein
VHWTSNRDDGDIPRLHLITGLLSKLPFLAILIDFPWVIGHEIPDRMKTRFQRNAEALGGMLKIAAVSRATVGGK